MAPKKADPKQAAKKEEKPKKPEMSPEMKELKEKEKNLTKVSAPDRAALDEKVAGIQSQIDGLQEKLTKLNAKIQDKSQGKEEHFRMKEEIRSKLDAYSAKIDELEKQKGALKGNIQDKRNEQREKRGELNSMKSKLQFKTLAEIDGEIRNIEYKMQTESLTIKQEKDLMVKIKELKASKPLLSKYEKMEGAMGPVDTTDMKSSIDEINAQLSEVREAKKLQQAAYSKLIEARNKVMGDVPELFKEREELNGQVRALYGQRQEARDEFNTAQRAYSQYQRELRDLRNERWKIERAEKQKEWEATRGDREAEDAASVEVPFFAELQYLDNMIRHLKAQQPKEAEEEKKAETKIDTSNAPGEVLLAKGARDEEFFFAPTKKKQLKKKGGAGNAKPKALVHDIKTLAFFDEYKVAPPSDVSQIANTLKELDAKVEEFKVKQAKKIEENKKKAEDKAAGKEEEAAPAAEETAE